MFLQASPVPRVLGHVCSVCGDRKLPHEINKNGQCDKCWIGSLTGADRRFALQSHRFPVSDNSDNPALIDFRGPAPWPSPKENELDKQRRKWRTACHAEHWVELLARASAEGRKPSFPPKGASLVKCGNPDCGGDGKTRWSPTYYVGPTTGLCEDCAAARTPDNVLQAWGPSPMIAVSFFARVYDINDLRAGALLKNRIGGKNRGGYDGCSRWTSLRKAAAMLGAAEGRAVTEEQVWERAMAEGVGRRERGGRRFVRMFHSVRTLRYDYDSPAWPLAMIRRRHPHKFDRVIRSLTKQQKKTLQLRYVRNLTLAEIAAGTGRTESAVSAMLADIVGKFRAEGLPEPADTSSDPAFFDKKPTILKVARPTRGGSDS